MHPAVLLERIPNNMILAMSGEIPLITHITTDPQKITPQSCFVCVNGTKYDTHQHIRDSLMRKPALIVLDEKERVADCGNLPYLLVKDTRPVLSYLYFALLGHPEDNLIFCGITGTNGKTSTAWYLTQLLRAAGKKTAMLTTIHADIDGEIYPVTHTTLPPEELTDLLKICREREISHVVMEVSSHALAQGRVAAIPFELGIFTNLTEDHLDYHGTMENYLAAKKKLLYQSKNVLLNMDTPEFPALLYDALITGKKYTYSAEKRNADYCAVRTDLSVGQFQFLTRGSLFTVRLPTPGYFTVQNLLCAIGGAMILGADKNKISKATKALRSPDGRLEKITTSLPQQIYIDYAHTPDALQKALQALRQSTSLPIYLLFGCGGDREKEKRPKMGRIASDLADHTVITSDNCRSEKPEAIICDIMRGFERTKSHDEIVSRRDAIIHILSTAPKECVILLAGKGHEDYEIDNTGRHPFSEREVVAAYEKQLRKGANTEERGNRF